MNPKRVRILFAPENRGVAVQIAVALGVAGHEAVLDGEGPANAAIVLWTPAAARSPAVIDCARQALAARVLAPVALGKTPPPPSFEHLSPMDLAGWSGDPADPRWRFILEELEIALRRNILIDLVADLGRAPLAEALSAPRIAVAASARRRVYAAPAVASLVGFASSRRSSAEPAYRLAEPPVESPPADDIVILGQAEPCDDPILLDDARASARFDPLPEPARSAPRLPRAPLVGALFLGALSVVAVAAYFIGVSAPQKETEATAKRPPVVAYVEPVLSQDPERSDPPADDPVGLVAADETLADVYVEEPAQAQAPASPIVAEAPIPLPEAGPAVDVSAPRVKPATMAALTEESLKAQEKAAVAAAEADPIAGLAWESTRAAAAEETYFGNYFRECVDCPDMAVIEAGGFAFGSPADERGRNENEGQIVDVAINRRFAMSTREVTFEEWDACVSDGGCPALAHDSGFGRGKMPVINVSWSEARAYAVWLSKKTGGNYRLPTEAEWEYAARGASATPFWFGDALAADKANYDGSRPYAGERALNRRRPVPAGSFPPNPFGLFDMHGNVAEWTADCWAPGHEGAAANGAAVGGSCDSRVVKGGAWNSPGADLRAAARQSAPQAQRLPGVGIRVSRDLE